MRKAVKTRRRGAVGRNGDNTDRCAKCGAPLPELPKLMRGAVPVRCEKCFGAAPRLGASALGEWLDRFQSKGPAEVPVRSEVEELAEAA